LFIRNAGIVPVKRLFEIRMVFNLDNRDQLSGIGPESFCLERIIVFRSESRAMSNGRVPTMLRPSIKLEARTKIHISNGVSGLQN
jgi:hypothetical protein